MAKATYDIITVGGGLGGSALAKVMAERGVRVLVLEREQQFKDRVRGENMHPWGVAEARALGIYELLRDSCGHPVRYWDTYLAGERIDHRDYVATTPHHSPFLTFYHPEMQEVLLEAAAEAGAEVRRGAHVRHAQPGALPAVVVEQNGCSEEVYSRLIVGADGRGSLMRGWAGLAVQSDPENLLFCGVLFENIPAPQDALYAVLAPTIGQLAFLGNLGGNRVRAYLGYRKSSGYRLRGIGDVPRFIEESVRTGAAAELYASAKAIGPLATFEGTNRWVEHPYKSGVTLIGDAAATNDPTWGQGLSMTLRDVRLLRDRLLGEEDWEAAGHAYAKEHDRCYGVIHKVENWFAEMFMEIGPEAEARRRRALTLVTEDGTRMPDLYGLGPELPLNEEVRRRFFGEE